MTWRGARPLSRSFEEHLVVSLGTMYLGRFSAFACQTSCPGHPQLTLLDEDRTFTSLKDSVSIQIFKIQSNVQGIQRLVDKLGGGADGPALRTSLCVHLCRASWRKPLTSQA